MYLLTRALVLNSKVSSATVFRSASELLRSKEAKYVESVLNGDNYNAGVGTLHQVLSVIELL